MGLLLLLLVLFSSAAEALEVRYPSGLLRLYREVGTVDQKEESSIAASRFLSKHFPLVDNLNWKLARSLVDKTHIHLRYQLFSGALPIDGHTVDLHYNHEGFIDYATSTWARHLSEAFPDEKDSRVNEEAIRAKLRAKLQRRFGVFNGRIFLKKILWLAPSGEWVLAFDAQLVNRTPYYGLHYIVHAVTGELLLEKRFQRHITHDVYRNSPDQGETPQTLRDLSSGAGNLVDSAGVVHVRREQDGTTPERIEVNPEPTCGTHFTDCAGFDASNHTGASYNHTCDDAGTSACPNQAFDSVNVFYHVKEFRNTLNSYISDLGLQLSLTLDPIDVTVNTLSIDFVSTSAEAQNEANNAFYSPLVLDVASNARSGLFFFKPAQISFLSSICPGAQLLNLAREALVIVHEYQHYITDKITAMVAGSTIGNVGDVLHEGYSDYAAASHITALNGTDVTTIGGFAFKNCTAIQRDVSVLKPFQNAQNSSDPPNDFSDIHIAGLSWASGLWQLRTELGQSAADKLALKSLTFLSTKPSFIEAVEALVQADQALNNGANVSRIRSLFYTTLNFLGAGSTNIFRDSNNLIVELGFRSCASVGFYKGGGGVSVLLFLLWLFGSCLVGRMRWKK